jgi:toxin secretion/phage lysis holin
MQYIIMITIVLGLALSDFVTGIIKGYVTGQLSSSKMRRGGLNKGCELVGRSTACGLEVGIRALGEYYSSDVLATITGAVTAIAVFVYIVIMELISILENYAEIDPQSAGWIRKLLQRLKNVNDKEDK